MKKYRDYYFIKAKHERYPARSVYKLQELNERFHLFRPGMKLLDLGAAPGSWSLWSSHEVGSEGKVLALDIQSTNTIFPPQVIFLQADIFSLPQNYVEFLEMNGPFDLVMSDMAPKTTGSRFTDQARSLDLALKATEIARQHLTPGGKFVVKVFMGPDVKKLLDFMHICFASVKNFKPRSSRSESKETFFIGIGFQSQISPSDFISQ